MSPPTTTAGSTTGPTAAGRDGDDGRAADALPAGDPGQAPARGAEELRVACLSPQGAPLTQAKVKSISDGPGLILLCGRYEAIDQRFLDAHVDEEISVGDFVVSGGELPALLLIDAVVRLLPGVLNDTESAAQDSFVDGLLDCPHYTRPEVVDGCRSRRCCFRGTTARSTAGGAASAARHPEASGPTCSSVRVGMGACRRWTAAHWRKALWRVRARAGGTRRVVERDAPVGYDVGPLPVILAGLPFGQVRQTASSGGDRQDVGSAGPTSNVGTAGCLP